MNEAVRLKLRSDRNVDWAGRMQRAFSLLAPLETQRPFGRLLRKARGLAERTIDRPVRTNLHGRTVWLLFGNPYLRYTRLYPTYNTPLVAAVKLASTPAKSIVVDVGAAIGDTALLIAEECGGLLSEYICIEGDPVFFSMLQVNIAELDRFRAIEALLGDDQEHGRTLVRTHQGTASPQGSEVVTIRLDALVEAADVIKIDTDGFDGRVLSGARGLLERSDPVIIFEWHPILMDATGSDAHEPFVVLEESGYSSLLWFSKTGEFSHQTDAIEREAIDAAAAACRQNPSADMHFDIVALPRDGRILPSDFIRNAAAAARPGRG